MKKSNKILKMANQFLGLLILLNVGCDACASGSELEEKKCLQTVRLQALLEKNASDPVKAFDSLAFGLPYCATTKVPELSADLVALLAVYGGRLDRQEVFYKLGDYSKKVDEGRVDYQPLVDQMKRWISDHYVPDDFSNAYYAALVNGYKGIQDSLNFLHSRWSDFCDASGAIARFEQEKQEKQRLIAEERQRVWESRKALYESPENQQFLPMAEKIFQYYNKLLEPSEILKVIASQRQYLAQFGVDRFDEFLTLALTKNDYFALEALTKASPLREHYFPLSQIDVDQASRKLEVLQRQLADEVLANTGERIRGNFYFMEYRKNFYQKNHVSSLAEIEQKAFTDDLPIDDFDRFRLLESLSVHAGPVLSCKFLTQWEERAATILTSAGYVKSDGSKGHVSWKKK